MPPGGSSPARVRREPRPTRRTCRRPTPHRVAQGGRHPAPSRRGAAGLAGGRHRAAAGPSSAASSCARRTLWTSRVTSAPPSGSIRGATALRSTASMMPLAVKSRSAPRASRTNCSMQSLTAALRDGGKRRASICASRRSRTPATPPLASQLLRSSTELPTDPKRSFSRTSSVYRNMSLKNASQPSHSRCSIRAIRLSRGRHSHLSSTWTPVPFASFAPAIAQSAPEVISTSPPG